MKVTFPDYPSIKAKIGKLLSETLSQEIRKDPFLSKIGLIHINEGNITTYTSIDGYSEKGEEKEISSPFEITEQEIIDQGPKALFSKIPEVAKEFVKERSKLVFEKMEEVTQKTGNVVNANSPITPQIILDALEKIQFDFDEYGNPILPSLILHPDQYERIKDEIPKWESDEGLRKRHRELIEKKRQEWIDRENNRKLVD